MFDRAASERRGAAAILAALRRRWWVIALVGIIAAGGAYYTAKRKQTQYTASSQLLFTYSNFGQLLFGQGQTVVGATGDPTRDAATNLALLSLPSVAQRVHQQLGLSAGRVLSDISVGSDSTSDVVSISATDPSPTVAAAIANAWADQYIALRRQIDQSQLKQAVDYVNSQLAAIPPSQVNSTNYNSLQQQSHELQEISKLQTGNGEIVQRATPPTSPSFPHPRTNAMIGLILGLLVGVVIVVLVEQVDRRLKSESEIEDLFGVPILGRIPDSAALQGRGLVGNVRDQEAFRMTRTQLRYFDVNSAIKSILITSADAGEGKSTVALNLARASAGIGSNRSLLIEADLRRPSLAEYLGLEHVAGLSELLSQWHDPTDGLRELVVALDDGDERQRTAGFDVLLAGTAPPNPLQLLESGRMSELVEYTKSVYDYVIIDAGPMRLVPDPLTIAKQVDGVLVVSRLGYGRRDHGAQLMKQLRGLNANVLGVIINGAPEPARSAYYGYAYYGSTGGTQTPRRKWRSRQDEASKAP
jgi:capsular exopolysaccharide synthesis family protein